MHVQGLRHRLSPLVSGIAAVSEEMCRIARFFVDVDHSIAKYIGLSLWCFYAAWSAATTGLWGWARPQDYPTARAPLPVESGDACTCGTDANHAVHRPSPAQ